MNMPMPKSAIPAIIGNFLRYWPTSVWAWG
jgi:hypothetical protein